MAGMVEYSRDRLIYGGVISAIVLLSLFASSNGQANTSTTITLTWTASGDDGTQGTASYYDIRYSNTLITEATWISATQVDGEPTPQPYGSGETFTITGLTPNTVYYVGVKVADEVFNWSPLSNIVQEQTLPEQDPPGTIANLSITGSLSNSITLTWTAPGDDGNVGRASQYDVRYSTQSITNANWNNATQVLNEPTPLAAGSAEFMTVSNLNPNTTYYFAVKTADEVPNWSALSNVVSGTTSRENVPPASIADLYIDSVTSTTVTLAWTAPGDDGIIGTASQYDVRYSLTPLTEANWSAAVQVSNEPVPKTVGSFQTMTISNLRNGSMYYFAIKTADEVPNWSALSNVANGSTDDRVPPAAISDFSGSH